MLAKSNVRGVQHPQNNLHRSMLGFVTLRDQNALQVKSTVGSRELA